MVFSTTNLFKGIQCPQGEQCALTNCIFSHDLRPQQAEIAVTDTNTTSHARESYDLDSPQGPATKRRKVTYEKAAVKPPSKADLIRKELAATRRSPPKDTKEKTFTTISSTRGPKDSTTRPLPSLEKSVSPPPTNGKATSSGANNTRTDRTTTNTGNNSSLQQRTASSETLNPRIVIKDPVGHAKRTLILKHLHGEMVIQNQRVLDSQNLEHKHLLHLSEQELIKLALGEEEKIALEQPLVYANIIKQRIAHYKKMKLEDWVKYIKTTFQKDDPKAAVVNKDAKPIETGLTLDEEVLLLPHLITDQSRLTSHGYIPTPPTEAQAAEAAAAVAASKNYEICDRCSARFQVFLERNDEGKLTSNGPCKHHPNKKVFPNKTKGDVASGLPKEPYYPCCNGVIGSPGCTENEYHVFKSSSRARLAAVLPFITTPENSEPARDKHGRKVKAVTFDCEMGYTVYGLELIRITAVSWPSGDELLDVLVRPIGAIIDLNSRFSGVWPEQFANATSYEQGTASNGGPPPIVANPQKARELLCSFLTPKTPLIGHAIDNDLNSVRLCHPTIIDTVILYPHPRGLPMRFGLKMLTSRHLGRHIQTGGDRGHDSLEDAQATGDLVRLKAGEKWKFLRAAGWEIDDGELVGPPPPPPLNNGSTDAEIERTNGMLEKAILGKGGAAGRKRRKKRPGMGGDGADESTGDEELPSLPLGSGVAAYLQREQEGGVEKGWEGGA